ncbi:PLP-dependent transferase [Ceraceosorus guamensis]|uniref:phosphoserine transaminase n=1 Tax=Ceraceosorus guamensis TaxID=1522189 RepID=A0A316W3R0_9BASI|nr:PLP-dependent transferase [Ceraceosorus guamensis]PWN44164.1 PLP-dependent transferase [Ceraceosorus guamensis]
MSTPDDKLTLDISKREGTINLGAGPSSLPTSVLLEAAQGILDFSSTGMGLTELSHRSGTFKKVIESAEEDLRKLLDIPENYAVLFMQGGGTEQFSGTALNLLASHAIAHPDYVQQHNGQGPALDYAVSGSWSAKALKESKRLGGNAKAVFDSRKLEGSDGKFGIIPPTSTWQLSGVDGSGKVASKDELPAMLYYCDNETVDGVEYTPAFPIDQLPKEYAQNVPIVADCSSNILSRKIDIAAHSIVFFGAQKNVGPAGVTIVIVKKDLIARDPDEGVSNGGPRIPTTLAYKHHADANSLYNTPPMFAIYASGLVFADLLKSKGGVVGASQRADMKSRAVYDVISKSQGVFAATVKDPASRSRMNICFRILARDGKTPNNELEERFIKRCREKGIEQVKGHRSVGGIRTSLYNAVSPEQTLVLVDVMKAFAKEVQDERRA